MEKKWELQPAEPINIHHEIKCMFKHHFGCMIPNQTTGYEK